MYIHTHALAYMTLKRTFGDEELQHGATSQPIQHKAHAVQTCVNMHVRSHMYVHVVHSLVLALPSVRVWVQASARLSEPSKQTHDIVST
jgi:hypothetical protein